MNQDVLKTAGAREKALVLLTDMDRTEQELREKLSAKGFSAEEVSDAVEYVRSYGYVDDERYARRYVEIFSAKRSRKRIEYDLIRKGIRRDLIDDAMSILNVDAQEELVESLARKKMRTLDPGDPNARRKLMTYLSGKGFSNDQVIRAAERMLNREDY